MIEIALYNHQNDTFEKQNYPFVAIEEFTGTSFADFTKEARAFILRHSQDQVVVINKYPPNFDFNLFAIALTVESLRTENYINCVAIQVSDLATATEAFKPFIALTFGLKYVHTLQEMDTKSLFRDLSSLTTVQTQHPKRDWPQDCCCLSLVEMPANGHSPLSAPAYKLIN